MTDTGGFGAVPAGITGLSAAEAERRLAASGPNRLVPDPSGRGWRRRLGPLADPMVALLLVAVPTYLLLGETLDAVVASVALGPVALVGWLLEGRAERTLRRLRELAATRVTVLRDGERCVVPSEAVVVGDVLWVREGDVVPADARVLDATQVSVDEAALTGESLPVAKGDGGDPALWAGTTVVAGRALAEVVVTGTATRYGQLGTLVARTTRPATPLQRALTRLVAVLAVVAVVCCAAAMAAELLHGSGWGEAVIAGVSLAIAAIPEEFSIVYTLYLALGAWELARHDALVRNLPGVETLGSTTVICTDKTGTLTEGRLDLAVVLAVDGRTEDAVLTDAVLACEPDPFDPLERAVLERARSRGIDVDALHAGTLGADWPFDPVDRFVTHVWTWPDGTARAAAKGSFEGIVRHASVGADVAEAHDRLAAGGARVLAVAAGPSTGPTGARSSDEAALVVVGLIAFHDPVRAGVAEALASCRSAGIRVIMLTGDHPATAHAVAEGLGLPHGDGDGNDVVATGADLDAALDPGALDALVARANVFARVRPEHKHLLVESLQRHGEVVAMTGDGINDAPALRQADIGVAMGRRGTAVAREAATVVLLDDEFATIVDATRNGRRIYDSLTRAFAYLVAFHPPLLVAALVVPLLGEDLLLLPVHLVILEVLLHPIVSLVFQADRADADVMDRPPRPASWALSPRALARPYAVGVTLAAGVVGTYLGSLAGGWPVEQARALGFVTLLAAQPFLLLGARRPERAWWRCPLAPTGALVVALAALVASAVAVVHLAPLAAVARLEPFPTWGWAVALAVAAATTSWIEPTKRPRR